MYVAHSIEFLRAIRRVLRKDGVCFWSIGDSYAGSGGANENKDRGGVIDNPNRLFDFGRQGKTSTVSRVDRGRATGFHGLKPKDLCLIPFRVALAAQADGWWVRSVIIWSKNNPMPESCKDRPTDSHEYILMLTKSAKYYWDIEAVRENGITGDVRRPYTSKGAWDIDGRPKSQQHGGEPREHFVPGRNIRSVWTMNTQPFPEAHFAVFPEELPRRCILAASKQGDIVLDPFSGAGTTGMVAKQLGRRAILIDTSEDYCRMAQRRIEEVAIPMTLV